MTELLIQYTSLQVEMTNAMNSPKGITKALIKREREILQKINDIVEIDIEKIINAVK